MLHAANSSTTQRNKVNQQLYILTGHKAYLGGLHP
jgi:hypothetical protein